MKKILFLLLGTVSIYGQTLQNPTFGIVTEKNNATNSTPTYFVTQEVDGVHKKTPAALVALKSDIPASYAVIVYVNATSPSIATIFDDENPPTTNDNAFKTDADNLYIGTDASTWVWNGSSYVTKTLPESSNFIFNFVYPPVDSGSNKTADITRIGAVNSESSFSSKKGFFVNKTGSDIAKTGGFFNFSDALASNSMMFQLNALNGIDLWNYASGTWNKRFTFSSGGNFTASTYNGYTPANDNAVVHLTGNETIAGVKSFSPSISASTNLARGTIINPSLTATANNDVLVGLDIAPSFTNGVFTGVKNYGIRSVSGLFTGTLSTPLTIERTNSSNINIEYKNNTSSVYAGVCNALAFGIGSSTDLTTSSNLKVFTVTGNTVLQNGGSSTDDGVNRLQVTGTVSSGTTTLGNTPPTANNQLTRKDYVDTKAPTASPTFTGTPIAPTAAAGTNTTQIATTAFVQENVIATQYWTKTVNDIRNNNTGNVFFGTTGNAGYYPASGNLIGRWVNGSFSSGSIGIREIDAGTDGVAMYLNSGQAYIYGGTTRNMNVGTLKTDGVINASINNVVKTITSNSRFESLVPIKLKNYTVATLPTGTQGDTAYVTDATSPTYSGTLTGGGSVVIPVFYNGTAWVAVKTATDTKVDSKSARFELSADLSLPISTAGSVSVVDFDSSIFNNDTVLFSNNGSGVITCNRAGIYLVTTSVVLESPLATALTRTDIGIRKNGTAIIAATTNDATLALGNNVRSMTTSTIINLAANDTIEAVVNLFGATATGLAVRLPSLFGTTVTQVSNISIQKLEL